MTQNHLSQKSLPNEIVGALTHLGKQIRIARKRRAITMEEMASRMFVTRKTLWRLENGDPGVTLGILASALWVLGLEKELGRIAQPEHDEIGIYRERKRLPKRVRVAGKTEDLDF